MIAAHKSPVAYGTNKLLLAGVRSAVPGELVRAGEPLVASFPAAAEGLLTYGRETNKEGEMTQTVVIRT